MPSPGDADRMRADQQVANRTLLKRLAVVVVAMFGFGYLMVPFYEKICEVTGIRNIGRADIAANTQVDKTRTVRVELDGNLATCRGGFSRKSRWSTFTQASSGR